MFKNDQNNGFYSQELGFTIQNFKHFRFVENLKHDSNWLNLFKAHTDSFHVMQKEFDFLWNLDSQGAPSAHLGYSGHLSMFHNLSENNLNHNKITL